MTDLGRYCCGSRFPCRQWLMLIAIGGSFLIGRELPAQEDEAALRRLQEVYQSIPWQQGPALATIADVAEIQVPVGYQFTGGKGAAVWWDANGNAPDSTIVGAMMPVDDPRWFLTFYYDAIGRVPDDEGNKLDADAILKDIRENTAAGNAYLRGKGLPELLADGWIVAPKFDDSTKNLVWGVKGSNSVGNEIANFDTKILGRRGVMSVKLVTDPASMNSQIPTVKGLLSGFQFKSGQKYAEWRSGDKIAKYGLTGLITGGVTAAAAKSGFLQKFGKFLIAGLIALGAAFKAFFTGKKCETQDTK